MKQHIHAHTRIALVVIFFVGLFGSGWTMYSVFSKEVNPSPLPKSVVIDFHDCKKRGYPIIDTNPEQCKTPTGTVFMNLEEYLSTVDAASIGVGQRSRAYEKTSKSSATSTYRGIR